MIKLLKNLSNINPQFLYSIYIISATSVINSLITYLSIAYIAWFIDSTISSDSAIEIVLFRYSLGAPSFSASLFISVLLALLALVFSLFNNYIQSYLVQKLAKSIQIKILQCTSYLKSNLNFTDKTDEYYLNLANYGKIVVNGVINPCTQIISSSIMFCILSIAVINSVGIVSITFLVFVFAFFLLLNRLLRATLSQLSKKIDQTNQKAVNYTKLSIISPENFYCSTLQNDYKNSVVLDYNLLMNYNIKSNFIITSSRPILEFLISAFLLSVITAVNYSDEISKDSLVKLLSVLTLSGARLIPSFNQIILGINTIKIKKFSLGKINELFSDYQTLERAKSIESVNKITILKDLENSFIIRDFSLVNNGIQICKPINYSLPFEGLVVITGKSGTGKSTLLSVLAGFTDLNWNGQIQINHAISDCLPSLSFSRQNPYILPTIYKRLCEHGKLYPHSFSPLELACANDMPPMLSFSNESLSGGQRQRLSIAQALMSAKLVTFLDEPTTGLDSGLAHRLISNLILFSKSNLVIATTHDPQLISKASTVIKIEN